MGYEKSYAKHGSGAAHNSSDVSWRRFHSRTDRPSWFWRPPTH